MTAAAPTPRLVSFDFIALCLLVFLTFCNTTVYYSLDVYLEMLGIAQGWRGFLIGSSSLATIASYLVLSPLVTVRRAPWCASLGAALMVACGFAYLAAATPLELLVLRLGNGLAFALLLSSATALFVRLIPPGLSGRAFGLYSISGLLPFSVVPAAFDHFTGDAAQTARGYMLMSLFLVPALVLMLTKGRGMARRADLRERPGHERATGYAAMLQNAARPPVAMLLAMTTLYLTMFSSVFFLAKAFFLARPVADVGMFFSLQMLSILAVRLASMGFYDRARKTRLLMAGFALSAVGCLLTATAHGPAQAYAAAMVLGAGMGIGSPMLNAVMFTVSEARFQAVNTNLLGMFQQMGSFLGPVAGAAAVQLGGGTGFLVAAAAASFAALLLCLVFERKGMDRPHHAHADNAPDAKAG